MHLIRQVDEILNGITMYRLLVYVLSLLLAVSLVFMLTGVLAYSALGLVITTGVLSIVCFATNMGLAKLRHLTPNHESGIITTLILACILPQATTFERALWVGLAGATAIAVKYLVVWRGSHFLNPAATGAAVVSVSGLLPVTWWIGNPSLFIPTLLLGLLVLRKVRRFTLFGVFVAASAAMMLLVATLGGNAAGPALSMLLLSYPLVFLGAIMLTEPTTMPAGRLNIALYGLIVGALFTSQLDVGLVSATPHVALLVGNLFSLAVSPKRGARLRLKSRTPIGRNLYDLAYTPPTGTKLPYAPGQYLEWTLPKVGFDSRGNRRTFTIASSPTEKELHIGIKMYEPASAFKQQLLALEPGDVIQAGHIGGSFTLPSDPAQKLLFIAGGIGITPFRSMLKYLTDSGQQRDIILIYSAQPDEFAYKSDLEVAAKYGVKTFYFTGRLDAAQLADMAPDFAMRLPYISGPNGMVAGLKSTLVQAGVPRTHIHTDLFTGY